MKSGFLKNTNLRKQSAVFLRGLFECSFPTIQGPHGFGLTTLLKSREIQEKIKRNFGSFLDYFNLIRYV